MPLPPSQEKQNVSQGTTPSKRSANDFIFVKQIGEGSFSTVYLTKDVHTNKEYAIKVCDKRHILREKKAEYVKREKEVLNLLSDSSAYFVRLYCTFQDKERLYFVLSFAKNGEMLQYLHKVGSFDLRSTRFYTAELVLALEVLHSKGVIHRDLKPDNILLDERMHILITDFGSAKIVGGEPATAAADDGAEQPAPRRRRNSFVGTAQYVSPELLTDTSTCAASDLWALGCILYQMVAGLPPFRAPSEYLIFQKILKLDYEFPEGFADEPKDLVEKLLVLEPQQRLGASDAQRYTSLRAHRLFAGLDWARLGDPPNISPFVPDVEAAAAAPGRGFAAGGARAPGLDDKRMTELELASLQASIAPARQNIADVDPAEAARRLEEQRRDVWHPLVEGNLILKKGLVDKRKGLFARRRMLLLTLGPHLYYVDPGTMVLKGEIPWGAELRVETKNFKVFFVHTANRTYYLEDPDGYAMLWRDVIQEVHQHYFPQSQLS